jgi:hypothetical protein
MPKITIKVEKGTIQMIDGIPLDVCIEVRNYDVAEVDEKMISADEDGRSCQIVEWHAPE